MARDTLTGSRIRERRSVSGFKQAELARKIGISASYLNLIEHNRRRIGGKLLVDIAEVLGVEPSMLTEGAEAALIATLREAAADAGLEPDDSEKADEFAGRFPTWADVLARAHRRISALEQTVETLSDRLTHDPHLAASVHELLTTATAIRSVASILAEPGELEREWRDRFHRNLNEDSLRLADSSKALVDYLEESGADEDRRSLPQEDVEAYFAGRGFHFPELEAGLSPDALLRDNTDLNSPAARKLAVQALSQYARDATRMPLGRLRGHLAEHGPDPIALAQAFGVDLATVFRRLAAVPSDMLPHAVGLVICDAAGSLLFRKPIDGFAVPRYGAACPLWPLYSALSRPLVPIRRILVQEGRNAEAFDVMAVAEPVGPAIFDTDPLYRATMLILPATSDAVAQPVGSTCRICPRHACPARREPSILRDGV